MFYRTASLPAAKDVNAPERTEKTLDCVLIGILPRGADPAWNYMNRFWAIGTIVQSCSHMYTSKRRIGAEHQELRGAWR
jgi:hypothetical protein